MTRRVATLIGRALRAGVARSALVVCGIGVGMLLVLVLVASYRSVASGVAAYVGHGRVDLWIAPRGTTNLIRSSAMMPAAVAEEVGTMANVREAAPLLRTFVTAEPARAGSAQTLLVIGYAAPEGLGGPPRIFRGREVSAPGEVVLDRAAAHRLGVVPNDTVNLNGHAMRLVGVSADTNLIATQFAFVDRQDAERLSGVAGRASFVAIGIERGADVEAAARALRARHPELDVFSRDGFVANNVAEVGAGFRPIQILVSAVGLTAAAILVALLVQGTVDHRKQDIAILFALGAMAGLVARGLLLRTTALVALGTALGAAAARALEAILDAWFPTVQIAMRLSDVLVAALMMGVAVLAACVIPFLRLQRIDPVEAFRP